MSVSTLSRKATSRRVDTPSDVSIQLDADHAPSAENQPQVVEGLRRNWRFDEPSRAGRRLLRRMSPSLAAFPSSHAATPWYRGSESKRDGMRTSAPSRFALDVSARRLSRCQLQLSPT